MKVTTTFFRRVLLFARSFENMPEAPAIGPDFEVRKLEFPRDWDALRELRRGSAIRGIERRVERGHECFSVWHGSRIVHAAWAATGPVRIEYLHRDYLPGVAEVFLFDHYTLPEYRRRHLSRARSCFAAREFLQRGIMHGLGIVAVENDAAIKAALALDYRVRARIKSIGLGPFNRVSVKKLSKEPPPRLVRRQAIRE